MHSAIRWGAVLLALVAGGIFARWRRRARRVVSDEFLLSAEVYTDRFAAAAREAQSDLVVSIASPLQVTLRHANSVSGAFNLRNAFLLYESAPHELDQIIAAHVDLLCQAVGAQEVPPRTADQIVPVLHGPAFVARSNERAAATTPPTEEVWLNELVHTQLTDGLFIFYVFDRPSSMSYVTGRDAQNLGLPPTELDALSPRTSGGNSARRSQVNNAQGLEHDGIITPVADLYQLFLDGIYDASAILLPDLFSAAVGQKLQGAPVIYPLARDAVFVTGAKQSDALDQAEAQVLRAGSVPYFISQQAFVLRDGAWAPFRRG